MNQPDRTAEVIKRIKELPPLPLSVQKLLQVINDQSKAANDIARVLETDQALAGKVLKLVNSAFYGFTRQISTITHAVVILGNTAIRHLAMGFGAMDSLESSEGYLNKLTFWRNALACATSGHVMSTKLGGVNREEAFIAGMLHDIGQLVLDITFPGEYEQVLNEHSKTLCDREMAAFGITHELAGELLLESWQLPPKLVQVTKHHHAYKASMHADPLARTIVLADPLASMQTRMFLDRYPQLDWWQLALSCGLDLNVCTEVQQMISNNLMNAMNFLDVDPDELGDEQLPPGSKGTTTIVAMTMDKLKWLTASLNLYGYATDRATPSAIIDDELPDNDLVVVDFNVVNARPEIVDILATRAYPTAIFYAENQGEPILPPALADLPLIWPIFEPGEIEDAIRTVPV